MRERTIRLRRNKPDRKGRPGFWKMRLTWVKDPRLVGKLYEVGLGTRDAREAVNMARGVQALIRALEGKTPLILFSESEFPVHRGGMKGQTFAQEADNMRCGQKLKKNLRRLFLKTQKKPSRFFLRTQKKTQQKP